MVKSVKMSLIKKKSKTENVQIKGVMQYQGAQKFHEVELFPWKII